MKTVLITGSNKGIGYEIARQLGKKGFEVVISGRSEERLSKAKDQLAREEVIVRTLIMDVGNPDSVKAAAKEYASTGRKLDVLINNAAIALKEDRSILKDEEAIFTDTINTNAYGALCVSRAFLSLMSRPSRIIMISSGGGSMTDPVGGWSPAYCVSKTMLNGLTRHLAYELESMSISVNAVCPGWVKTDMGGSGATRPVEKGAETPVWLASEAPQKNSGLFFRDKKIIPW